MKLLTLALLATAIAAAGCGPSLTSGTVVSIGVLPAHSETYQSGSVCAGYDAHMNCEFRIPIYATRWVPDRCFVTVKGETSESKLVTEQHEYTCDPAFYATKPGDPWHA